MDCGSWPPRNRDYVAGFKRIRYRRRLRTAEKHVHQRKVASKTNRCRPRHQLTPGLRKSRTKRLQSPITSHCFRVRLGKQWEVFRSRMRLCDAATARNVHLRYDASFQAEVPETTISPQTGNRHIPSTHEAKVERRESLPAKQQSSRQGNAGLIVLIRYRKPFMRDSKQEYL